MSKRHGNFGGILMNYQPHQEYYLNEIKENNEPIANLTTWHFIYLFIFPLMIAGMVIQGLDLYPLHPSLVNLLNFSVFFVFLCGGLVIWILVIFVLSIATYGQKSFIDRGIDTSWKWREEDISLIKNSSKLVNLMNERTFISKTLGTLSEISFSLFPMAMVLSGWNYFVCSLAFLTVICSHISTKSFFSATKRLVASLSPSDVEFMLQKFQEEKLENMTEFGGESNLTIEKKENQNEFRRDEPGEAAKED